MPGRSMTLFGAALLAFTVISNAASAQERRVPPSPPSCRCPSRRSCKRVAPAVVNVYAAHVVENRNPLMDDPFFRQFFGGGRRAEQVAALARLRRDRRSVGADRHQLPRHRRRRPGEGRARRQARVRRRDRAQGSRAAISPCCASRARNERFPALEFGNSDELQVGDVVLAIGNPFGVGQTVTHGIVSAVARTQVGIIRLSVLHPDRRRHQSRQFRRRAGRYGRPAGRHQHRDLLALRRLAGHRLRHSRQHGARRGGLGARAAAARSSGRGSAPSCRR